MTQASFTPWISRSGLLEHSQEIEPTGQFCVRGPLGELSMALPTIVSSTGSGGCTGSGGWVDMSPREQQSLHAEIDDLKTELSQLNENISQLTDNVSQLTDTVAEFVRHVEAKTSEPEMPANNQRREISIDQAVVEIRALFKQKGELFYSEIMDQLNLGLETVLEACQRLESDDVIEATNK